MQLIEIDERFATVEFTPEDCYLLAQTCQYAAEHDMDLRQARLIEAFTAFFEAAALAAGSYSMVVSETPVSITAIRDGLMLDAPVWREA